MTVSLDIRLATGSDADAIASLSRREIEHELPWKWTPSRVRHAISEPATNVAVAYAGTVLVAPARTFYCKHGYSVQSTRVGMYYGLEDGVRLEKEITGDRDTLY